MPKQTFLSLPEDKRRVILDVALDEFSAHGYETASISHMVTRAGIAKGSFYQYFQDKRDLFLYLLELAAHEKQDFFKGESPPDAKLGMYAYLRWSVVMSVQFRITHPQLDAITQRAVTEPLALEDEIAERMRRASAEYYRSILALGILRGDVDDRLDAEVATTFLGAVIDATERHLLDAVQWAMNLTSDSAPLSRFSSNMDHIVDEMLRLLRDGLAPGSKSPT